MLTKLKIKSWKRIWVITGPTLKKSEGRFPSLSYNQNTPLIIQSFDDKN